jgi:hypothetical protein
VIPVVAPPLGDAELESDDPAPRPMRLARIKAPAGGARNAYHLVTHKRATWREAVLGSVFLLEVVTVSGSLAGAALAVRRWRQGQQGQHG